MHKSNTERRSPILRGNVVERLLLSCTSGCSLEEILSKLDSQSTFVTKIYLFILIEHAILSYNGKKRCYEIEKEGFNLLKYIYFEKARRKVDSTDIEITIEYL